MHNQVYSQGMSGTCNDTDKRDRLLGVIAQLRQAETELRGILAELEEMLAEENGRIEKGRAGKINNT